MLKSRFYLVLAATVLGGIVAGCSRSGPADEAGLKILHFGNGTEIQDLDPQIVTGVPENKVINALFEGLVIEGPTGSDTQPGVAAAWDSLDNIVWTFHLRPDAVWSDGVPITADTFVQSYQRILTPSLASEYAYHLHYLQNAEAFNSGTLTDFSQVGIKALNEHTLQMTLRSSTPYLIEMLKHYSWFPVPVHLIQKFDGMDKQGTAWTRQENFVGNGSFVLKDWRFNQKIIVERSPTYWDRANVLLDQIHFYPIDNIATEENMFRTGALHKTNELLLSKRPVYKTEHPDEYREDPYMGVYFYRLNVTRPPLNDVRVRKALALAIDREAIVENIKKGGEAPAYHFCPPSAKFASTTRLEGDLETARRLLAEAGYPDGQGFPRIEILFNTQDNHRVIAEAIQQMWRRNLNVNIGVYNQEWKVYLDSQDNLDYDISRSGWIADYTDPSTFMDMWVTDGGNNDTGWSSAEYDELIAKSYHTDSEEERMAIYQRMDDILMDEVPIIPIHFYTRVYALSTKVQNWPVNVLDNRSWKYLDLAE